GPVAAAPPDPYEIRLLGGTLTPAPLSAADRQALTRQAVELVAAGQETVHVLVQLHQLPGAAERDELWRQGLGLGAYASGSAWIAALPSEQLGAVGAWPEVRWLTVWDAADKLHPRVLAGDFGPWTADPSRPEFVMLLVQLHHDVELDRLYRIADELGAAAQGPIEGLHGMTVWVPRDRLADLAGFDEVLWVEEGPMPLSTTNDGARATMNVNTVNSAPYSLDGTGVRVFVFDGGTARATHETFNSGGPSRVTVIDGQGSADHPTHVAGTVAGDGAPTSSGGRARGVATDATLLSAGYQQSGGTMLFWDNAGDIEADYTLARNTHNADFGTNSIGSNTASNGYDCAREGDYGVSSNLLDGIVRGDNAAVGSPMILTWANGNERSGGSPRGRCGANYLTTAPPSCAKNPIHIGALNSDGSSMTGFSSWGPCDDGRLKPIVSAPGCETGRVTGETSILSSFNTSNTAYGGFCGTSMATPATAGVVAMLIEDWRARGFGGATARPLPALVKSMLIHTARDLGTDGPDFHHGYGLVDSKGLIDLLRAGTGTLGTGTTNWGTDSATNASVDSFFVTVPAGTGELKASLAWDDAAAAAFVANALINNLDLELVAPDGVTIHRPFVNSAANPHLAATTGINNLDNQEQVLVTNPAAGNWTVRVRGTAVPSGPQTYGLSYSTKAAAGGSCTPTTSTYEAGNDSWTLTGAARLASPAAGHGAFSLRLGGTVSTTHEATRDFAIPAGVTSAEVSYFWYMTTLESAAQGFGWDPFTLEIRNTAGTVLAVVDSRNDGWRAAAWQQNQNVDLTPWAGTTVRLAFRAVNDSSLPTTFWVDDVVLTTCAAGGGNTAPVVAITAPASGSSFAQGTSINFSGTATDAQDGSLSAGLSWTSSINGSIGSGASFSTSALSIGVHTITASVTDSGGLPGSNSITVTVTGVVPVTVTFTSVGAQDGYVTESGENTNVGGSVGSTATGTSGIRVGDNNLDRQVKAFVSFNTSSIPDGATITSVTLRLRRGTVSGTNPYTTHGTAQADVHSTGFGGAVALATGDFQAAATAANVATMSNPAANLQFSEGVLNAAGLAAINKTGTTQFRVALTLDDNDDVGNDYIGFYPGENATAANRPQLVVTYTP
ncbi:MAG TPA: S8 family serine peptidase, partial [Thermoanaerobaculia bacterium]|nr:S8 family serine peptidase [Thermoanaerobaculia bacterium]